MTGAETPFMLRDEISKIHPVSDPARKAAEKAGLFPKRFQLAKRVAGWSRAMVAEWERDPNSWVQRHQSSNKTPAEPEMVSG
jgi:predicted DNA-binding transcriptional regulator AlpA